MKMKKHIIFSILLATVLFAGCKKDDGMLPKDLLTTMDAVPQPTVVQNGGSGAIDLTNLASFQGKFDVKLLYPNDVQPAKLDVVIMKNGNTGNVKVFQAGVTTYPSSFTITAAQIASLFGAPITLGDNYDIGVDIYTQKGNKYLAFPATGAAYGSTGVANQPGFSPTTRYSAICAYDPNVYQGNFVVTKDLWADMTPGDIVVLTKIDATHFSFIYNPSPQYPNGTLLNAQPIIVTINTATNVPSVALQTVGTGWTYDNSQPVKVQTTTSANNFVAPCDKTISLNLNWTQGAGSYTGAVLQLKKQ